MYFLVVLTIAISIHMSRFPKFILQPLEVQTTRNIFVVFLTITISRKALFMDMAVDVNV